MHGNINVDKIFQEFGLEVQQVEPYVYKVLNTEKEISVEELQDSLVSSILITSERTGRKRLSIEMIQKKTNNVSHAAYDKDIKPLQVH